MSAVVTVASVVVVIGLVLLVVRKVIGFLGTVAVAVVGLVVLAVLVSALFGVGDGLVPEGLSGVGRGVRDAFLSMWGFLKWLVSTGTGGE